jgi:hypothetical protein
MAQLCFEYTCVLVFWWPGLLKSSFPRPRAAWAVISFSLRRFPRAELPTHINSLVSSLFAASRAT